MCLYLVGRDIGCRSGGKVLAVPVDRGGDGIVIWLRESCASLAIACDMCYIRRGR